MREREQKLDYIARMNEKHCSRVPVYGQDLCHTVDVFRDMNKTCVKDNTWKGLGMVYCHNVLIKIESKHSKINQPPNLFISIRCTCTNLSTMSSIFLRNCSGVFTRSESTLLCIQHY
jgi:hypothetical protein